MAFGDLNQNLEERLFGQKPNAPAENRPGMDVRGQARLEFQGGPDATPPSNPHPFLTPSDLARADLFLKQLSAWSQNTNITASLPAWNQPHIWTTPVDLSVRFTLPAAAGTYLVAITYQAQPGRWARISGYGVDVPAGFSYDGSILWAIRKNGQFVDTLFDWGQHRGTLPEPRETFVLLCGDNGSSAGKGDIITFEVKRAVAAGGPTDIDMCLVGWTWRPRFNYEGTKVGITSF